MGYAQPISLLPSSGYAGNGIGLPVLVGRNASLSLLLATAADAPVDSITSIVIETSAFAVRDSSAAHSVTWRQLGAAVELTGPGSTSVSIDGADAFVRARYSILSEASAPVVGASLQGRASCTLLPQASRSGSGVGPTVDVEQYHGGRFALYIAAAPVGQTLVVAIERSGDGVSGWTTAAAFSSASAAGEYVVDSADLDKFVRVSWTASGGTWTFGVSGATSLIFARSSDRTALGIRQAAIPNASSSQYLAAFEVASATIRGDLTAFALPLRSWDSDIRRACIALADWHLLTSRGEPPQEGVYRESFLEWSAWLAQVGGRVPGAAGRRIRPSNVVDSTPPERDGSRALYKFQSDEPRDSRRGRRVVW